MDLSPIIEQLAKKHEMTKGAVTLIVNSQFSFINEVIRSKEYKSVILTKLGKIAVKPNRLKLIRARLDANKVNEQNKIKTDNPGLEKPGI